MVIHAHAPNRETLPLTYDFCRAHETAQILAFLFPSCPLENLCSVIENKITERVYWQRSFLEGGREGTLGTRLEPS